MFFFSFLFESVIVVKKVVWVCLVLVMSCVAEGWLLLL